MIPEHAVGLNITTTPVDHAVKPGSSFNPLKYCYCITVQTFRDVINGTNTSICIDLAVSSYTMSFASIRDKNTAESQFCMTTKHERYGQQ